MPKSRLLIQAAEAPVNRAIIFVCEKCGRRAGGNDKHSSYRLASKFKRRAKAQFEKHDVRVVLSGCMDMCPEDRIAISVQPSSPAIASVFLESDMDDIDASSDALMKVVCQILGDDC